MSEKTTLSAEYTPDLMSRESLYLNVKSPWNFGASYQLNDYVNLSTQYLLGSQVSVTAHISVNPGRPPLIGGKELAPVPMRSRSVSALPVRVTDQGVIRKVLAVDGFEISDLDFNDDTVTILVKNTKFRSTAQAVGRIASTLQRFTADDVQFANISFYSKDLIAATYRVNLEKITSEQFQLSVTQLNSPSIMAIDDKYPTKD